MCRRFALLAVAAALLGACNAGDTGSGSASCASAIEYDRHQYLGHAAHVAPGDLGQELGEARIPPCNDTGDASGSGEAIAAMEIQGVSPEVAVAASYSSDVIFVRVDHPFESLPEQVRRLLTHGGQDARGQVPFLSRTGVPGQPW